MDEYNANEQFLTTYQAYYNKPIEHFSQKTERIPIIMRNYDHVKYLLRSSEPHRWNPDLYH